jgi:HemY protein
MPVSPISGRLDAFVWTVPPATLSSQGTDLDDVLADLDDDSRPLIEARAETVEPAPAAVAPPAAPAPAPAPAKADSPSEPAPKPESVPAMASASEAKPAIVGEPKTEAKADPTTETKQETKPEPALVAEPVMGVGEGRPKPVIFPVAHAPDDPGPEEVQPVEDKKGKFRLFG